jgi:hypothetical protein
MFNKMMDAIFGVPPAHHQTAEAILDKKAADHHPKLDYKNSIVDLLELVGLPSDLKSREELAKDLHYPGPFDGSAKMNEYLHKHMMARLGIAIK